ncbi:hypothetical protein [Streptomyces sp. MMS24-I29]
MPHPGQSTHITTRGRRRPRPALTDWMAARRLDVEVLSDQGAVL